MRASLNVLLMLVIGGVALGFDQDWLRSLGNEGGPQQDADAPMVPKEPVRQRDDRGLGHRAEEATRAIGFGGATAIGWVKKIEPADCLFTITTVDNEKLTVHTGASTMFRWNGRDITLDDLQGEDQVRVDYALMNGKIVATAITVDRR